MSPLILIGVLLIVVIAAGMFMAIRSSDNAAHRKRVLSVIKGSPHHEKTELSPRQEQDKRRVEIARKLKNQGDADDKPDKKKPTRAMMLERAGLKITPQRYWIMAAISGLIFVGIAKMLGWSPLVMILFFIIGLLGFPRAVLRHITKRRQKKFLDEFADALEAMARLLKAGMPIGEAVAMAGREFEGPVGEEMSRMYEAQKIGITLPDAALQAARRMPLTEVQMFATGLSIQAQTGASLSEVLNNLAKVIRSRYRLRRKVQALSSEAKASAMIIGALPFLVGGGLCLVNPGYMDPLFNSFAGKVMLVGSAIWMGMGILVMKVMINFKV